MVAVLPSLCLPSLYCSTLLNRELAVSLHKLRPKCIPTVDTSFTSFISSIGQSLVLKSWSKEMTKLYYNFCRSICYQIVGRRRCDICALENFFWVFALHYWSMKSSHFYSVHNNTKPISNHIEDSRQSLFQFLLEVVTRQLPIYLSVCLVWRLLQPVVLLGWLLFNSLLWIAC